MTDRLSRPAARSWRGRVQSAFLLALLHLAPAAALASGPQTIDWAFMAIVYPIQAIGIGVGLHRYFAHRSFKTSRPFQFLLALCAATAFGEAITFSGKHRLHHQYSDAKGDVHTPLDGWWACWIESLLDHGYSKQEILNRVPDLERYPELMWLHRNARLPGLLLLAVAFAVGGFSTAAIGVCLPAIIIIHQTSSINYFAHGRGARPFETGDHSTNNPLVAILTFGEGWHNNHHRYPYSARAGIEPWEIDMFYWVICALERLGLVWQVRRPPNRARRGMDLVTRNRNNGTASLGT